MVSLSKQGRRPKQRGDAQDSMEVYGVIFSMIHHVLAVYGVWDYLEVLWCDQELPQHAEAVRAATSRESTTSYSTKK